MVSNAMTYPGFAELASLAKLYLIILIVGCLSCFPILSLSLDAILGFECWDVSWLHGARFARKIIFNYTCPWLFVLFWNAQFVFGCYSWFRTLDVFWLNGARFARKLYLLTLVVGRWFDFRMLSLSLDAMLGFEC